MSTAALLRDLINNCNSKIEPAVKEGVFPVYKYKIPESKEEKDRGTTILQLFLHANKCDKRNVLLEDAEEEVGVAYLYTRCIGSIIELRNYRL